MRKAYHYLAYIALLSSLVYLDLRFGPTIYQLSTDRDLLDTYLQQMGVWAPLFYVLISVAQVIAAPIPGMVLGVAGGYIFGLVPGFLLSLLGLFAGSMLAFALARRFGQPLVLRFVGQETYSRLAPLMHGRGLLVLAIMFLLPFLPDDALCFVAALTPIHPRVFALLVITCRSPGIFVASLTGSGIIQLPLYAWAVVGVVSLLALYLVWRNSQEIEDWLLRLADVGRE